MESAVAVILSTYNGEKYLAAQLSSLANQTYKSMDVFIHDDGSTDNTKKIIEEFTVKYSNFHFITSEPGKKYPKCFISLLKSVEGFKYYAFCDQDDVWNRDKIADGVRELDLLDERQPLLYYSAVRYCNSEMKVMRESRFAHNMKRVTQLSLSEVLFGGEAMGMTFLFNTDAKNALVKANEKGDYKDWFLKIYCAACGVVLYNPRPSAMYRRHEGAVTGESNPSGRIKRYYSQIKEIFISKCAFADQKQIIPLLRAEYYDCMSIDDQLLLDLFSEPNSFGKRRKKLFYHKRFRRKLMDEIGYRVAFMIGRI